MINTSRPATQHYEDSSFRIEYQSDMDRSLVTLPTLDALREPQNVPRLSDTESFKSIPEDYFSSTSYNSYLESGSMIRVDNLFKPLLRRFRSYFRTRFDRNHNKRNYHRWTNQ